MLAVINNTYLLKVHLHMTLTITKHLIVQYNLIWPIVSSLIKFDNKSKIGYFAQ